MQSSLRFLDHPGEMAQRIREADWSNHPLGPPEQWPQALRFALDLCLSSSFPMALYWGADYHLLYNDAWSKIPADRHPWALGRPGAEVWADIWDVVGPDFDAALYRGQPFVSYDQMLPMERDGIPRETYWNYSGTPLRDETGAIVGILNQGNETTRFVLAERERRAEVLRLRELFQQAPGAITLLHGERHVVEFANDAFFELVGKRDLTGRPLVDSIPEVATQGFIDLLDNVFQTGKTYRAWGTPILLARSGDGTLEERILDFTYQPIRDAAGHVTGIFVQATDGTDRYIAEKALRESETRLQLALDASHGVGTWDWDVVNDRVTADEVFAKLYGVAPEKAKGGAPITDFFESIHPDDTDRVRLAIDATLMAGKPFSEEYRIVQPEGEIRWIVAMGRALHGEGGELVRFPGVTFDITSRKEAEENARATADELRVATEAQAFIYALAERQRALDTPQAIMRFTAAALGRRLGLDRAGFYRVGSDDHIQYGPCWTNGTMPPLKGSTPLTELGDEHVARYRSGRTALMRDAAAEPQFANSTIGRLTSAAIGVPLLRQGKWVATMYANQASARDWSVEDVAFIEAVAEISWDAVERVNAVAALKESEQQFRAITNSIDQMVWSCLPNGSYDYFNDRWYEFTGVARTGRWASVIHPDDMARVAERWSHSLTTGEPYHIEYRLREARGGYRWVLGRAQPVRDDSGAIVRWFGTSTDIQEIVDAREVLTRSRKDLERAVQLRTSQLMAAEEQLRQAQKMEAVGQLTGGIAHDFNNMLAVVIGALDLMERRLAQGSTDIGKYIVAARDGAQRAAALTRRLLAFARQTPLAPRSVDVNQMVLGMVDLLVRTLGEDIAVKPSLGSLGAYAVADPSQLENSILNLAVNARDAMPRGGTLDIATGIDTVDREAAARMGISPGDYIRISVADTGTGMPSDVASRAFEPFFTTKAVGQGTGLGLSQVFGFVHQSGGHVRIDSTPAVGTTVHILLPCSRDAPGMTAAIPTRDLPRAVEGESIMVVEDEDRVRNFSVEALRELDYDVSHAMNGEEALALLGAGQRVSLLFTDMVMPGMNGRELAEAARELDPDIRILFTSGYNRDQDTSLAGDVPLLAKPFDLTQLALSVRRALDSSGAMAQKVDEAPPHA